MVDSVVMLKWPTFAFSAVSPLIGRPSIVNQNDLGSLIPTISDIFLFSILMLSLGRTSRTTVAPVRVCSSSCKCRYEASGFVGGPSLAIWSSHVTTATNPPAIPYTTLVQLGVGVICPSSSW